MFTTDFNMFPACIRTSVQAQTGETKWVGDISSSSKFEYVTKLLHIISLSHQWNK